MTKSVEPYPRPGYMTLMEFARHRDLSHVRVMAILKEGRLEGCYVRDNLDRVHFDAKKCDEVLDRDPSPQELAARERKRQQRSGHENPLDPDTSKSPEAERHSYTAARTANELVKLEIAQLELQELQGKLISTDKVKSDQFVLARTLRDQVLAVPDRISDILAHESDPQRIHRIMTTELREALKKVIKFASEELSGREAGL